MSDINSEIRALAFEAKMENVALQMVCAAILAELAVLHDAPRMALDRITTGLQGAAHGLAKGSGATDPVISKVIERICAMAEDALQVPLMPKDHDT